MEKPKRRTPSTLPLNIAKFTLILSISFAALTYLRSDYLYSIYAPFAGMIVFAFWIMIAVGMCVTLMWNEYRLGGQLIKAKASLLTLLSMVIVLTSASIFALTGF